MTKSTPGPPPSNEEEFKNLKALLDKAGLSVDEAVPVFGVTRTSIYSWMGDHGPQQRLIRLNALRAIALIKRIVEVGDLPLKEVAKSDRHAVLTAVFKKHLSGAKPAAREQD